MLEGLKKGMERLIEDIGEKKKEKSGTLNVSVLKKKGKMDEEENELVMEKATLEEQIQKIGNVDLQWNEPGILGVSS